jgi:hypothetical protein
MTQRSEGRNMKGAENESTILEPLGSLGAAVVRFRVMGAV